MHFLREELRKDQDLRLMCYSGRGGEVPTEGGVWRAITRDDAKRRFRLEEADVLVCTDAAAEGRNFQFCGALVNYEASSEGLYPGLRQGRQTSVKDRGVDSVTFCFPGGDPSIRSTGRPANLDEFWWYENGCQTEGWVVWSSPVCSWPWRPRHGCTLGEEPSHEVRDGVEDYEIQIRRPPPRCAHSKQPRVEPSEYASLP